MTLRPVDRTVEPQVLDRPVAGLGIEAGATLGHVVAYTDRTTLLVFLRHYG